MAQVYLHDQFSLDATSYTFGGSGTFDVEAGYAETIVKARVQDPEDTPAKSDILLVTVSYSDQSTPTPNEYSLILFDDGSKMTFPYKETWQNGVLEDCTVDAPNGIYECKEDIHLFLTSNDQSELDHTFTRGFAFTMPGSEVYAGSGGALLSDCLVKANHQYPTIGTLLPNHTLSPKIQPLAPHD